MMNGTANDALKLITSLKGQHGDLSDLTSIITKFLININRRHLLPHDAPNMPGKARNTQVAEAVRNRPPVGQAYNIRAVGAADNKLAAGVDNKLVAQNQTKSSSLRDHHHPPWLHGQPQSPVQLKQLRIQGISIAYHQPFTSIFGTVT